MRKNKKNLYLCSLVRLIRMAALSTQKNVEKRREKYKKKKKMENNDGRWD